MHVITVHNPEKFKRPSRRWRKSLENLQRVPHTKSVNRLHAQVTTSMVSVWLLNVLHCSQVISCYWTQTAFAKLAHQASRRTALDADFNLLTDLHTHTGPVRIFRKCPDLPRTQRPVCCTRIPFQSASDERHLPGVSRLELRFPIVSASQKCPSRGVRTSIFRMTSSQEMLKN